MPKKKGSRLQTLRVLSEVKFSRPEMRRNAELLAHSEKVPAGRAGLSSRQGNVYSVCDPPDHVCWVTRLFCGSKLQEREADR